MWWSIQFQPSAAYNQRRILTISHGGNVGWGLSLQNAVKSSSVDDAFNLAHVARDLLNLSEEAAMGVIQVVEEPSALIAFSLPVSGVVAESIPHPIAARYILRLLKEGNATVTFDGADTVIRFSKS